MNRDLNEIWWSGFLCALGIVLLIGGGVALWHRVGDFAFAGCALGFTALATSLTIGMPRGCGR